MAGCLQKRLYPVDWHIAAAAADGGAAAAAGGCAHGVSAAARRGQQFARVSAPESSAAKSSAWRNLSGSACQSIYAAVPHPGAAASGGSGGLQRGGRKA